MYTNESATYYAYENGKYTRYLIAPVFWDEVKASNVAKSGRENADKAVIYVPYATWPDISFETSYDMIIKGECSIIVDTSTQKALSDSLKELTSAGALSVKSVDCKLYGSLNLQHYKISCG